VKKSLSSKVPKESINNSQESKAIETDKLIETNPSNDIQTEIFKIKKPINKKMKKTKTYKIPKSSSDTFKPKSNTKYIKQVNSPKHFVEKVCQLNNITQSKSIQQFDIGNLQLHDMVLLKVPTNQFIPNQPRIGELTQRPNQLGTMIVHYYTGRFGSNWWPMRIRESPYLREEKATNVLMKFNLLNNQHMPPDVEITIKSMNNGVEND